MGASAIRWRTFLQLPFGIPVALVMFASWLMAWWKSTDEDKLASTVVAVYPMCLILCSVNALPDYLGAIVPFIGILIVRFIYRLPEINFLNSSRRMCYITRLLVILVYMISSLPPVVFMLYQQHNADFNNVVDEVAKVVGPKARVCGDPVFWVGHDRYIYGPYLIAYDDVTVKDALQWAYSQSFEYIVRAAWYGTPPRGFKKPPNKMPGFRPGIFTDNLCQLFGTKVYEFYDEYYGSFEIYKINWPSNPASWGLKKQTVK